MPSVIIIGGGIIGLCSAYYLQQLGNNVTIIDKTDMLDGCSYGNAGYLSPSHFVPLSNPNIVMDGLKWMFSSKSPFYVQPRLNANLINWGRQFIKSASVAHIQKSAIPLRDISLLSKKLYEDLATTDGFDFQLENKGMMEFFQTHKSLHHAKDIVRISNKLGLETYLLSKSEVEKMEPDLRFDILGAIYFKCDAHLYPNKLMADLIANLQVKGVNIQTSTEATGFVTENNKIKVIHTTKGDFFGDEVVLSSGAETGDIARMLNIKIPMIGGRGYSVTFDEPPFKVHHPIILQEARVAITPMAGKLRFGGTMEITSLDSLPKLKRVLGIFESIKRYFPASDLQMPAPEKIWYGFRPCSADGLPYIGRVGTLKNLVIASGHSMLGLSLGAATGKMVSEIINTLQPSIDLTAFKPSRFTRNI